MVTQDRAPSFWALARSYLSAADALMEQGRTDTFLPSIFLLCHALELGLKSYLLSVGATEPQLRGIGHDLVKCLAEAEARGLSTHLRFSQAERDDLNRINEYYERKELEYASGTAKTFPSVEQLRATVDRALTSIFNSLTEDVFREMAKK
jgi:hypothetical protein